MFAPNVEVWMLDFGAKHSPICNQEDRKKGWSYPLLFVTLVEPNKLRVEQ